MPENLLPLVRKDQAQKPLAITAVAAGERASTGVLHFIDSAVDASTGAIKLKARFANADRLLWPGQFVNVKARLNVEANRVLISAPAVQTGPRGKYVWVYQPAASAIRDITVSRLFTPPGRGEHAVVDSGLQAGETVISEGQKHLTPNAKVRLLPPGTASAN